ncbi:MAG: hypothetical protein BGN88_07155 [Clostridiales bacterium 43-6]|jgi:hypothetical protein|nr:MAG: hypothetical protein BGN88_07155 [Clostridiales bacterium 43-6]
MENRILLAKGDVDILVIIVVNLQYSGYCFSPSTIEKTVQFFSIDYRILTDLNIQKISFFLS